MHHTPHIGIHAPHTAWGCCEAERGLKGLRRNNCMHSWLHSFMARALCENAWGPKYWWVVKHLPTQSGNHPTKRRLVSRSLNGHWTQLWPTQLQKCRYAKAHGEAVTSTSILSIYIFCPIYLSNLVGLVPPWGKAITKAPDSNLHTTQYKQAN